MISKKIRWWNVDQINLGQNGDKWGAFVNTVWKLRFPYCVENKYQLRTCIFPGCYLNSVSSVS